MHVGLSRPTQPLSWINPAEGSCILASGACWNSLGRAHTTAARASLSAHAFLPIQGVPIDYCCQYQGENYLITITDPISISFNTNHWETATAMRMLIDCNTKLHRSMLLCTASVPAHGMQGVLNADDVDIFYHLQLDEQAPGLLHCLQPPQHWVLHHASTNCKQSSEHINSGIYQYCPSLP